MGPRADLEAAAKKKNHCPFWKYNRVMLSPLKIFEM
jgi:hypothetical protein